MVRALCSEKLSFTCSCRCQGASGLQGVLTRILLSDRCPHSVFEFWSDWFPVC